MIFYFFSRLCCQLLPFTFLYDWPQKRILFGRLINKNELEYFLSSIWPVSTSKGLKRYGTDGDGGYLLPLDISNVDYCFSAGIDKNSDFEFDITEHFNCPVFMLDASVNGPARMHKHFYFEKMWLGSSSNSTTYDINNWMEQNTIFCTKDIILKIDIEGSEYKVIEALNDINQSKLSVIVCEFHSFENIILKKQAFYRSIIEKILKTHDVVHLHPNNVRSAFKCFQLVIPTDLEITFIRKDLIEVSKAIVKLPNILDFDNTIGVPINLNWEKHV